MLDCFALQTKQLAASYPDYKQHIIKTKYSSNKPEGTHFIRAEK
jgi:hypothetical protein